MYMCAWHAGYAAHNTTCATQNFYNIVEQMYTLNGCKGTTCASFERQYLKELGIS